MTTKGVETSLPGLGTAPATTEGESYPSLLRAWIAAARPATLGAAAGPIFVGEALAFGANRELFRFEVATLTFVCAMLLQIGANFANDYFDFIKGADGPDRLGPPRATQRGWIAPQLMYRATVGVFALTALLGACLALVGGWPFWLLGAAAILAALGYTGGPKPYGYHGLGDLAVFVFFGPIAVCGAYYLQLHQLSWPCFAAGTSMGLLATAILVVNNIRDREADARAGKGTLAVRIGPYASRVQYGVLLIVALLLPSLVFAFDAGTAGWLVPLAATPLALNHVLGLWHHDGIELNPLLGATARLSLIVGLLLGIGGAF